MNKLGQPNTAGEGHIHYFMDVDPPTTPGQPAVTTPGTYVATADASYTWANVGGGQHKFSVELVNNDHTPLNPPVSQSISMLVIPEIGPPQAVILSPRDNAVINGNSITVEVQAANFNVVDKLGQANSPREGHIHYFIDVDAPTTAGQPAVTAQGTYAASPDASYTWQNVSSGMHSLSIELVNNDHSPLDPPVVSKIMVMVVGPAISPSPTATATPTPTATGTATPTGSGQAITIDLSAQNIAFDKATISVTAGANVTVNFNNKDAGIPHNFAVYQTLAGGQTKPIFVGNTITGPATTTYHFTAPTAAGTYFFECDIHPNVMNGTFVINGP
ncbi:MAG TPA: cupredoxin domain-containing protein [Dehalococcoidales bacterium]